jgi:HTH-type transcriptional regulator, sugar sensing transcriptional regulator
MDNLIHQIQRLGLNQYEAKTYVTLVKLGSTNAYQISKASGVPRARIYEILNGLEQQGFVMKEEINDAIEYSPLPVEVFLESVHNKWKDTYNYVEQELKLVENKEPEIDPRITSLRGFDNILSFCRILIRRAQRRIVLSMWNPMYNYFVKDLQVKQQECDIKGIVFQVEHPLENLMVHRETDYIRDIGKHKWFILSIDGKEMVYGHSIEQKTQAFYTDDPVHVYLLENYIWHDILVNRLVQESDKELDSWIPSERIKFFSE